MAPIWDTSEMRLVSKTQAKLRVVSQGVRFRFVLQACAIFRCAPDSSHSNMYKFGGAVDAVSWVSILKMWLWLVSEKQNTI